jgi:hypothetical protein
LVSLAFSTPHIRTIAFTEDRIRFCGSGRAGLKTRFVYDTKWRAKHGQPLSAPVSEIVGEQGKQAQDNAYIEWTCRNGICEPVQTKLKDDIRLYTYLPRSGSSDAATLRQVLLLRRGAVETVNSCLKNLGVGREAEQRVKWGGDVEMDWLTGLACCYLTGRRLAHETGDYQRAYEDAIGHGLVERPSRGTASPSPCVQAEHPGFYSANTDDADETRGKLGISSLRSWHQRTQRILAEEQRHEHREPDNEPSEEARATEEAVAQTQQELAEIGDFELPLLHELDEWDPADEDDSEIDSEDGAVQDLDEDPENAPLASAGLDVDEYVKTYGDVDATGFLDQFAFDPNNPLDAIKLAKQLDADEGLDDGELLADGRDGDDGDRAERDDATG